MGIHCINCQSTIPPDQIEAHSGHCVQSDEELGRPASSPFYQLTGFAVFLRQLLESRSAAGTEAQVLGQLHSLLRQAKETFSQQLVNEIEALAKKTKRLSTRVYIERAALMAKALPKAEPQAGTSPEPTTDTSRVSELQKKLKAFQSPPQAHPQPRLHLDVRVIENICSEVASRNSVYTLSSSRLTGMRVDLPEDSCEDPKRVIYAMILNAKLRLPENHRSQRISPESIYFTIQRSGLSPENWKSYIEDCLQSYQPAAAEEHARRPRKKQTRRVSLIID